MARPKGAKNIVTREVREVLKGYIAQELQGLPARLEKLTDEQRVNVLLRLLPYVLPKIEPVHHSEGEPIFGEGSDMKGYTVRFV